MANIDPQTTAIIIALIAAAGSIYSARVSAQNKKDTSNITSVLSSSNNIDSLDKVILALQRELREQEDRHRKREEYLQEQIDELTKELGLCRSAREQYYKDVNVAQSTENEKNKPKH